MKLWIPSKWTLEDQIHHLSSITIVVLLLKSIMQHICATVKTPYIVCGHQSHTGNPCNGSMDKKTLWWFSVAIENGPFIVDLPFLKMVNSIAMLVYQRVYINKSLWKWTDDHHSIWLSLVQVWTPSGVVYNLSPRVYHTEMSYFWCLYPYW